MSANELIQKFGMSQFGTIRNKEEPAKSFNAGRDSKSNDRSRDRPREDRDRRDDKRDDKKSVEKRPRDEDRPRSKEEPFKRSRTEDAPRRLNMEIKPLPSANPVEWAFINVEATELDIPRVLDIDGVHKTQKSAVKALMDHFHTGVNFHMLLHLALKGGDWKCDLNIDTNNILPRSAYLQDPFSRILTPTVAVNYLLRHHWNLLADIYQKNGFNFDLVDGGNVIRVSIRTEPPADGGTPFANNIVNLKTQYVNVLERIRVYCICAINEQIIINHFQASVPSVVPIDLVKLLTETPYFQMDSQMNIFRPFMDEFGSIIRNGLYSYLLEETIATMLPQIVQSIDQSGSFKVVKECRYIIHIDLKYHTNSANAN